MTKDGSSMTAQIAAAPFLVCASKCLDKERRVCWRTMGKSFLSRRHTHLTFGPSRQRRVCVWDGGPGRRRKLKRRSSIVGRGEECGRQEDRRYTWRSQWATGMSMGVWGTIWKGLVLLHMAGHSSCVEYVPSRAAGAAGARLRHGRCGPSGASKYW